MKSYFEAMFQYERWANEKVLDYLQRDPQRKVNQRLLPIFNHLVADALPWLPVLRGEAVPETLITLMQESPQWTVQECRGHYASLQAAYEEYLRSRAEADFDQVVSSVGPRGQLFPHTVAEVLTHLLSHGQHHRGQIEWLIEQETGEYMATSYMPYLRQRRLVE